MRPDRPAVDRHDLDREPEGQAVGARGGSLPLLWDPACLWNLGAVRSLALAALQIAKIGAVLGNVALGVSSLQALYVNRRLATA